MNSAGRSNISSIFQHGLQDGYLSLNPHVKGGLFPLRCMTKIFIVDSDDVKCPIQI